MELAEAVSLFDSSIENKNDNYCDGKEHDPIQSGKSLIDGLTGTPTPANLLESMKKHNKRDGKPHIPKLPKTKSVGSRDSWDIDDCDNDTFPWQTHHIIPKKFLPTQSVCTWLTKKYTKHPKYQLSADTRYSTDHSKNGYCLPFASSTYQWRTAKNDKDKENAAFLLMKKTDKQLHQGNHNHQEFDEEDDLELEQYLESIKELLKRIFSSMVNHVMICKKCKQTTDGKFKVQPLDKVVDQVDVVSLITKLKIDANKIFVSQKAYDYYSSKK